MMRPDSAEPPRLLAALDPAPVRVWSLIATVYGDAVLPRGGELWLGTLSEILAALAVEPASVRAAVSRLARDGFLLRRRAGRTSHYRLSAEAVSQSHAAEAVIYRDRAPAAPPGWNLLIAPGAGRADRRALLRAGHGVLAPGVFARPRREAPPTVPAGGLHLTARGDDRQIARTLYPLCEIAARYQAFGAALGPLADALPPKTPREALALRIALVHGFRRIVLRDPHLPLTARPPEWPADAAYAAFARLYRALQPASDAWLDEFGRNAAGGLPPAEAPGRFLRAAGPVV